MKRKVVLTDRPAERVKLTDAPAPRLSRKAFAKALGAEEFAKAPKRRGTPTSFISTRLALFRQHGLVKPPTARPWHFSQSFDDLELLLSKAAAEISDPEFAPSNEEVALEILRKALSNVTDAELADIRQRLMETREADKSTKN